MDGAILPEKIYTKEISSDPELLPELEKFIVELATRSNLRDEKLNNLALSFSEAASNSVVHGNKLDKNKKVKIIVKVNDEKMTVIIKDEGKGFDIKTIPDPTKPENILKDSGRGIHIMRSFLDDLRYNFTPSGTETILEISLI
ncbi:MAG: ATP-binding protein [Ignavibacteriae bacterium HGW-Ignavibacteriae-3]|nr:MAG: ATP-binding protein [Ignavibacteriae bacterium HGW-Ignavibacteriae-3]